MTLEPITSMQHSVQPYDQFVYHVTIDEHGTTFERLLMPSTGIPADICRANNALRPRWGVPLLLKHNMVVEHDT